MRKAIIKMITMSVSLITFATSLLSCNNKITTTSETATTKEVTKETEVKTSENTKNAISFKFASKEEGIKRFLDNKDYLKKFNQNKLEFTLQKKGATMEEYIEFGKNQTLEWTDEEKDIITRGMKIIEDKFDERNWKMPPLDTIVFVKTTMKEENNVDGYTHGTEIYLKDIAEKYKKELSEGGQIPSDLMSLLSHELFHCLTRCNPDFRVNMYKLINFTVVDKDFELPPSVWEYYIANPDVEHHNSYATFKVGDKMIDCFAAFVTLRHFEKVGEKFFDVSTTALVPIDGSNVYYKKEEVSNFDEVFGKNTNYVIDPEECMAENFALAVMNGKEGIDGKGYANPEIIDGIFKILSKDS